MDLSRRVLLIASLFCVAVTGRAQLAERNPQEAATRSSSAPALPAAGTHQHAALTAQVIDAPHGTFGYEVYSNGKLFVRQTNLPGRPGVDGCATREQAQKLSALVIEKIQRGEMPPTVSNNELTALGLKTENH